MRQIKLLSFPNQAFSVTIGESLWNISIKQANNSMFADIRRNNEVLILGQRILPNQPIIPYRYLSTYGNFILLTTNDEIPNWQRFNIDQTLIYLDPQEIGIND